MTKVLSSPNEVKATRESLMRSEKRIGFVPTMGALHAGHLALVERAKRECDVVFVSIFVNPTQFNDPKDLEKYPRNFEADLEKLKSVGTDYVFFPTPEMIYPDGYKFKVIETEFSKILCGAHRPGHFDGVLTVVMKLFQIVQPTKAYFGEKDHQQFTLIEGMTRSLFLDVEIVPCPTVRESDGLAMSSRNLRLTMEDRSRAPLFYKALSGSKSDNEAVERLVRDGFKVDYVETHNGRRYGAVFLGEVRLIDNVKI